jgi:ATP-binding protein involved in chromosome partitioning
MKSYEEIVGDGGSRVVEQVVAQREKIARNLSGVRFVVAVGSGKGGVGKSTMTMRLGAALQRSGQSTAILDADINGPTQARLAGLQGVPLVPGSDGLALPRTADGLGVISLGGTVPESASVDFESLAQGDSHVWRATQEFNVLGGLLATVEWGELEFLLLDLPPGAERTFQYAEYLGPTASFVLVTIPSDLSRGVVARSVAALEPTPNRLLGYVENMKGYYCAGCGEVKPLFPESDEVDLGIPSLGSVPFDPELARGSDRGEPLPKGMRSEPDEALNEIAATLRRSLEDSQ